MGILEDISSYEVIDNTSPYSQITFEYKNMNQITKILEKLINAEEFEIIHDDFIKENSKGEKLNRPQRRLMLRDRDSLNLA